MTHQVVKEEVPHTSVVDAQIHPGNNTIHCKVSINSTSWMYILIYKKLNVVLYDVVPQYFASQANPGKLTTSLGSSLIPVGSARTYFTL